MTFNDLGIIKALEEAVSKEEITTPTAIQEEAVPVVLAGRDVYISSPTGTGKTLAYLLPLGSRLDVASKDLQVVIVTPTHELSSQIQSQLLLLNQNSGLGFRTQLLIGGASTKRQLEKLKKKPHIIVGSTGRILELIRLKKLKVHNVQSMVIDEADNTLLGEKLEGVKDILHSIPGKPQLILVSATNQAETNEVAASMSADIVQAHAGSNQICDDIEHIYFTGHSNQKQDLLRKVIRACDPARAIVFTHRNATAEQVAAGLAERGLSVAEIHGKCDKLIREKSINDFKRGKVKILVASDMAARGLDVKGVTHIFNVDIPGQSKAYLHRAGRTGRAGAHGYCISLMSAGETKITRRYERELNITMMHASIAGGIIALDG